MSQVPLIPGDVNPQEHINQTNTAIRELNARDITEVFKDDTGVRRVLIGKGADGFYGLKVSKPTFDVYTAEDDELVFNSSQNVFKIVQTGVGTLPSVAAASSGSQSSSELDIDTEVESDTPLIAMAFYESGDSESIPLPFLSSMPGPTFGGYIAQRVSLQSYLSVGVVHILIEATNFTNFAIGDRTIRWYLLQESALPS